MSFQRDRYYVRERYYARERQEQALDLLKEIRDLLLEVRDNTKSVFVWSGSAAPEINLADQTLTYKQCVCPNYRPGELAGGWTCPIHGHQM
jgi:hypothetical protein